MIYTFSNNTHELNGEPIDTQAPFYLLPKNNTEYYMDHDHIKHHDHYILVDISSNKVSIHSKWSGEYTIFYSKYGNSLIISTHFDQLLQEMKRKQIPLDSDKTGIFESMLLDAPIRDRTLFINAKKVISGHELTFDLSEMRLNETASFILPFNRGDSSITWKKGMDQAMEILSSLLNPYEFKGKSVLVPMSGGMDSRFLGSLANSHKIPFTIASFGAKESTEPFIAGKIADSMQTPFIWMDLKNSYYKKYGDKMTLDTGGLSNHRHCHLYACLKEEKIDIDTIIHGYLGNAFPGSAQRECVDFRMTEEEALDSFIANKLSHQTIWQIMDDYEKESVIEDLKAVMKDMLIENLPCHFEEYCSNVDRQFSLITHVFSALDQFGEVIKPYANKEYALFFNTLPPDMRYKRKMFREAAKKLFPAQFEIGTHKQISTGHISGKIETALSKAYAGICFSSLVASRGKIIIRNPKSPERYREILATVLSKDLEKGVDITGRVLNKDLKYLKGIRFKNRPDMISQYRALSFGLLSESL